MNNVTYRTSEQILKLASSNAKVNAKSSHYYMLLNQAKQQHGSKLEKIDMVLAYQKFDTAEQFDECFDYLFNNL